MAASVLTPAKSDQAAKVDDQGRGPGGYGSGGPGGEGPWDGREWTVPGRTYRLAMWFALTAIVMLFAAFTSALVVRKGFATDWVHTAVPRILWINTGVLLASSLTLELSRRALTAGLGNRFAQWLNVTLGLGTIFLVGQLLAWRELASRGIYLASNPSGSFFYLLTAAHGVHLLGGVVALAYAVLRARRIALAPERRTPVDVTAIYWHFMDALWIYILFLLVRWS